MEDVSHHPFPQLPQRAIESHKGNYGRLMLVGGSRNLAGAIGLAGMAALRSGAGLVTLVVPQAIQSTVASFEPSYMTHSFGSMEEDTFPDHAVARIHALAQKATVVALGPGLGRTDSTARLAQLLYRQLTQPLVVDADGLHGLANHLQQRTEPVGPRILTPHPGEFAHLTGCQVATDPQERIQQAARLSNQDSSGRTVVVLKGHQTLICDGQQYAFNTTGNPGMATGGTGDCLTGIITALLGQGLSPWDAARLGVYVHGKAGDYAATQLGQISMIASDLIPCISQIFKTSISNDPVG